MKQQQKVNSTNFMATHPTHKYSLLEDDRVRDTQRDPLAMTILVERAQPAMPNYPCHHIHSCPNPRGAPAQSAERGLLPLWQVVAMNRRRT